MSNMLESILVNLCKAIFIRDLYVLVSLTYKFFFRILACIVYLTRHIRKFCFCFSQFKQPTSCKGLRLILTAANKIYFQAHCKVGNCFRRVFEYQIYEDFLNYNPKILEILKNDQNI